MDDSKDSFAQICLAEDRGQIAVVIELCKKHLREIPDDAPARLYYAEALIALARYATAEKAIRRAIESCPQKALPMAYSRMGHLFRAKGNFRQAAFWYRKALKRKPQEATYHIFLASNAFQSGLHKQSEAAYRRALKCSEGFRDEAYFNLGGILLGAKKYSEAIKCYQEALKIDPNYKMAKIRLDDAQLALLVSKS